MARVRAYNADDALALDNLALTAHFFDRSVYFHSYLQKCKKSLAKNFLQNQARPNVVQMDRVKHKERDYKLIPLFIAIF